MRGSNRGHRVRQLMSSGSALLLGAASFAVTLGGSTAAAQENVALEEVVVTARRAEESLMSVPLAITAMTSGAIEKQGIKQLTDIANFAPSFHFSNQAGGSSGRNDRSTRLLTFRGLSVAGGIMFVDGSPVTGGTPPPMSEVERVEVLTGPQSAYFGRSTFMGAMNFVTRDPSRDYQGSVTAEYSSRGSNELQLSVEGPLIGDMLRGRLTLSHTYTGGQYKNYGDPSERLGEQKTDAISGSVVFEPNEMLKVKAWGNYFVDNDGPPAQISYLQDEMNCNLGGTRGAYFCGTLPDASTLPAHFISGNYLITPQIYDEIILNRRGFVNVFDPTFMTHGGLKREGFQGNVRIDYELPAGFTFSSLTAYNSSKQQVLLDMLFRDFRNTPNPRYPGAGAPYMTWFLMSQNESWAFSQELRITSPQHERLRGTLGFSYLRQDSESTLYGVKWTGVTSSGTPAWGSPRTPAVFGGVYYDLTDTVTISGEGRVQWDKIRSGQTGFSTGFPRPEKTENRATFKSFSPRVIIDWEYAQGSTAYALYSRGVRPGGFNTSLIGLPSFVLTQFTSIGLNETFEEETIDNFELGLKSTWLGGRARTTLAVYYDKWRDGQVSTSVPYLTEVGQRNLLTITQNLGAVDLKGLEFQGDLKVNRNLTMSSTFTINDSKIKDFICGDCLAINGSTDATGNRLPQAEKYKFTASADYVAPLSGSLDWFARADYIYRGPYYLTAANISKVQPSHLVNLRAGIQGPHFKLEGFVKNLLQEDALTGYLGLDAFTNATTNSIRIALPDRRAFGIRASYDF